MKFEIIDVQTRNITIELDNEYAFEMDKEVTVLVDEDITDEYIKECVEYVDALFTHSANIIEKDYYGYLFPDGVPWEQ